MSKVPAASEKVTRAALKRGLTGASNVVVLVALALFFLTWLVIISALVWTAITA